MRMYDIIASKRDGMELTTEEIQYFVKGCADGSIPDYQISALLMAIYINGMSDSETLDLTYAMRDSGEIADLSGITGPTVDKHSTGGVGDKTTMIIVPMAAAIGCKMVKMSGRGLGHTGGTVDKLESIPGFRTELSQKRIIKIANKVGACMVGHSGNLAPADKVIYNLRDVTATVDSLPLIASSIMSKKLACGADCILLDVKFGSGALMQDMGDAMTLANDMVKLGKSAGKKICAVLTSMDDPLGYCVGNALEVIESVRVLKGEQEGDLYKISTELTAHLVHMSSGLPMRECIRLAEESIENGSAFAKFKEIVKAQGGDPSYLDDTSLFPVAKYQCKVRSERLGFISKIDTELVGEVSMKLGAGRSVKEEEVDHSAGIVFARKTGDYIQPGDLIATLYSNDEDRFKEAKALFKSSLSYSETPPDLSPLIFSVIK